ncbi:MAG TPA: hypothetical protein VFH51_08285 [Myxococcota bacterium]|nr:hypothetical protein [Myxococcota bacterium]
MRRALTLASASLPCLLCACGTGRFSQPEDLRTPDPAVVETTPEGESALPPGGGDVLGPAAAADPGPLSTLALTAVLLAPTDELAALLFVDPAANLAAPEARRASRGLQGPRCKTPRDKACAAAVNAMVDAQAALRDSAEMKAVLASAAFKAVAADVAKLRADGCILLALSATCLADLAKLETDLKVLALSAEVRALVGSAAFKDLLAAIAAVAQGCAHAIP